MPDRYAVCHPATAMYKLAYFIFCSRWIIAWNSLYTSWVHLISPAINNSAASFHFLGVDCTFSYLRKKIVPLHISKNSARYANNVFYIYGCVVKSSIQALNAFCILLTRCAMVAWRYADAFFKPHSTCVETKALCGAIISKASYECGQSGNCQ